MKVVRLVFFILGVAFTGVAVGIFYGFIQPELEAKKILENGQETVATVIKIGSTATVNDESYYYILLSFVDSNGNNITAKTSSIYPEKFLRESGIGAYNNITHKYYATEGKEVQVMYQGEKAVLKNYGDVSERRSVWILVLIFGGVGVGMFSALIFNIFSGIKNANIKQYGRHGTGVYLEHLSKMNVNQVPYYSIHFTFENDNGTIVEAKTGGIYRRHEAEAIAAMQTFPIRYLGDKAVIMVDTKSLLQDWHQQFHR